MNPTAWTKLLSLLIRCVQALLNVLWEEHDNHNNHNQTEDNDNG